MKPTKKQPEMEIEEHSIWQPGPAARAAYLTGAPALHIQPAIIGQGSPAVHVATARRRQLEIEIMGLQEPTP